MRLLNVNTFQLEEFTGSLRPPYAILSHTWGESETTYQDLQTGHKGGLGWNKIEGCCRQAAKHGYEYVWADTCCIDKSSSAELSEAINSMYQWYKDSQVCYVYMSDVPQEDKPFLPASAFRNSRWFSRGWTLQEFLAPTTIEFFDESWNSCFDDTLRRPYDCRLTEPLLALLSEITGISSAIVATGKFERVIIAQRLSWAANRTTTRVEDMAYSLLGLLGINMPLLYGEGKAAFQRLQEEVLRTKLDQSYMCWGLDISWDQMPIGDLHLAESPTFFRNCRQLYISKEGWKYSFLSEMMLQSVTNQGIQIEVPMIEIDKTCGTILILLPYSQGLSDICTAVPLLQAWGYSYYIRVHGSAPFAVPLSLFRKARKRKICILKRQHMNFNVQPQHFRSKSSWLPSTWTRCNTLVQLDKVLDAGFRMTGYYPPQGNPFKKDEHRFITFPFGIDWIFLEFTKGPFRIGISFHGVLRSRCRLKMRLFRIHLGPTLAIAFSVQRLHNSPLSRKKCFEKPVELEECCNKSSCKDPGHLHLAHKIKYSFPEDTLIDLGTISGDLKT